LLLGLRCDPSNNYFLQAQGRAVSSRYVIIQMNARLDEVFIAP